MAGPVGHIVCALAFLNSNIVTIADEDAFNAGNLYPDSRYVSGVRRSDTHRTDGEGLKEILEANSSFEAGRLFHVFVDIEREKHMREHNAYRFVKSGPLRKHMLKIIEDHVLFDKLKGKFDANKVFKNIYDEERAYAAQESSIETWHNLLITYLNQSHWFNLFRYYKTLTIAQETYSSHFQLFSNFWQTIKALGFLVHAYVQLEILSRNKELRAIILDFYENKIEKIIKLHHQKLQEQTVYRHGLDPPRFSDSR